MPLTNQMPFTIVHRMRVPAAATGASAESAVLVADLGGAGNTGTLASVTYTPDAGYTGANTNYRSFQVREKGAAGAGTTVMAQLDGVLATNLTAYAATTVPLSGTPANLAITHGDVIAYNSVAVGTGLADPGGLLTIRFTRD